MSAPLAVDLETPVREGFTTFATFLPRLLGFLVILVVGYFIAKLIAKLVDKALEKAGFDRAVEKGGVKKALSKSSYDASDIVAKLVFLAIFIPVIAAAIDTLGVQALREPMVAFIALIPKILVGIVLVVIGAVVAGAAKAFIANALGGLSYGKVLANGAAILILFGFVKAALDQVGIATNVTSALLYATLAAVAGVIVVGVGGGLIQPMQSRWENALNRANDEKDKVRHGARSTSGAEPYPTEPSSSRPVSTVGPSASAMDAPTSTYGIPRP